MKNPTPLFKLIVSDFGTNEYLQKNKNISTAALNVEIAKSHDVTRKLSFRKPISSVTSVVHFKKEAFTYRERNSSVFELIIAGKADAYLVPAEELDEILSDQLEVIALLAPLENKASFVQEIEIIPGHQPPLWKGYLAVVGLTKNRHEIVKHFGHLDVRKNWGDVAIAGFGPGNPELLTIKALKAIEAAEIIFHDNLLDIDFLNSFDAEKVYVGKRSKNHAFRQEVINEKLRLAAVEGKKVVRLKGGDPFIFGRGIEEVDYLIKNYVKTTVIPGISSAQAASVDALAPLTSRFTSSSVAWLSAHDVEKLKIPQADTLVFFMGASQQDTLAQRLITEGWEANTPVAVVQNASYSHKQIRRYTLESMTTSTDKLPSPVVIIVGWTAEREKSKIPKKWLNTGASISPSESMNIHAPLIRIKALSHTLREQVLFNKLDSFNQIVFTDAHAVKHFFNLLKEKDIDVRNLSHLKLFTVGDEATKELKKLGFNADVVYNSTYELAKLNTTEKGVFKNTLVVTDDTEREEIEKQFKLVGETETSFLSLHTTIASDNPVIHNLKEFNGVVFSHPLEIDRFQEIYEKFPAHLELKCTNNSTNNYLSEIINPSKPSVQLQMNN